MLVGPPGSLPSPQWSWIPSICHRVQGWFCDICPAITHHLAHHRLAPRAGQEWGGNTCISPSLVRPRVSVSGRLDPHRACSHLLTAVVRPLHPVARLQKVEEPLRRNPRVRVAPQGHNLPQQDTKGPPTRSKTASEWLYQACSALWEAQTFILPAATDSSA